MAKTVTYKDLKSFFGEEDHLEKSQTTSFAGMIFELLSEQKPTGNQLKVFELILNLSIDHGPDTPSALKVIEEAKKGETISEAVSEGIEQINDIHGGAIEPAMAILYQVNAGGVSVEQLVKEYIREDKKIPGLGHRVYKQSLPSNDDKESDPRTQLIFEKMIELRFNDEFIQLAKNIRQEIFDQSGKALTINIDGAIAVVLCEFGWNSQLGKAVFIIARTPGLCGQYLTH